jgi:hypothetical protein
MSAGERPVSAADAWKLPPPAKVYEAFSAVADGRVHLGEPGQAEVVSSGRDRRYTVEWSDDLATIGANDNASYWQGYLGYPALAALLAVGALHADRAVVDLFADVPWHDLNARFKRDYQAAVDSVLARLESEGADRAAVVDEVAAVLDQLAALGLRRAAQRRRPSRQGSGAGSA